MLDLTQVKKRLERRGPSVVDAVALVAEVERLRVLNRTLEQAVQNLQAGGAGNAVDTLGFLARTGNLPEDVCLNCGRPGFEHGGRLFSCPPDALKAKRA